jgi:DNA-binding MarR family transcriptional regulator
MTLDRAIEHIQFGYVVKGAGAADRRRVGVLLTKKGVESVLATSVLERPRLRAVLRRLDRRDLAAVVKGLGVLAGACKDLGVHFRGQPRQEQRRELER